LLDLSSKAIVAERWAARRRCEGNAMAGRRHEAGLGGLSCRPHGHGPDGSILVYHDGESVPGAPVLPGCTLPRDRVSVW